MPEGPAEPEEEDPSRVQVPEADWDGSESDSARREVRMEADRPQGSARERGRSPRRRREEAEVPLEYAAEPPRYREEREPRKGPDRQSSKGSKGSKGGGSKKGKSKGKGMYETRDVQRLVNQAVKQALRDERRQAGYAPGWYPTREDQWYYWDGYRWHEEEWRVEAAPAPPPPPPEPHTVPRPTGRKKEKGIECTTCGKALPPGDEMCRVCDLMQRKARGREPPRDKTRAPTGQEECTGSRGEQPGSPPVQARGAKREAEHQPEKKLKPEPPWSPSGSDSYTYEEEGPEESRPTEDPVVSVSQRSERAGRTEDRRRPTDRQRPAEGKAPELRRRPEGRKTKVEKKPVKEEPEPSDDGSDHDGASTARTSELRELLQRQSEKKPGERSKPSLSQVRIETFRGSRKHYKDWKRIIEAQCALYRLKDPEMAMLIYLSCQDEAREILNQLEVKGDARAWWPEPDSTAVGGILWISGRGKVRGKARGLLGVPKGARTIRRSVRVDAEEAPERVPQGR